MVRSWKGGNTHKHGDGKRPGIFLVEKKADKTIAYEINMLRAYVYVYVSHLKFDVQTAFHELCSKHCAV